MVVGTPLTITTAQPISPPKTTLLGTMSSNSKKPEGTVAISDTNNAKVTKTKRERDVHCVRCHTSFHASSNTSKSCAIEHDYDAFEGSRNGGSWYQGKLLCCGTSYKFHRHNSDSKLGQKYCFVGEHTTNPADVDYTLAYSSQYSTIKICNDTCGCSDEMKAATKEESEKQLNDKKRKHQEELNERQNARQRIQDREEELKAGGNTREARRLRAERLGLGDCMGLNSDEDSDDCQEFDCASDSSLVPPWELDG